MKKISITTFLLVAWSSALFAGQSANAENPKGRVTVFGCLQQGMLLDTYMLTDASMGGDPLHGLYGEERSDATLPAGKEPVPLRLAKAEDSYILVPESSVDLKSHIGQRVEITGKRVEPGSRGYELQNSLSPGKSSAENPRSRPEIRVSSVWKVSGICQ